MARRTCFARCVATADARSAHMEGGPVCMTNTCGRYVAGKACPCRSGFRAKSPCGKLSKTTNSARSPPTMHPNPERHQESPSFAALGRAGGVEFVRLPHREMQWAPVPIRSDTGIAAWRPGWLCPGCATEVPLDALQILAHAGGACNRCGGNCIGFLTELRPGPPGAAPPGAPVRLHLLMQQLRPPRPLMLLKLFLMMRPPPPRQVPVGLLQPSGLRGVRRSAW